MQDLYAKYDQFLTHDRQKLSETKKTIGQLAFLRMISFLGMIVSLIFIPARSPLPAWTAALLFLIIFLYAVKKFIGTEKEKKLLARLIQISQDERLALDEVFEQFDDGKEFTDPDHPSSFDLDLFGKGSMFQYLNRTVTPAGKKKLAACLNQPLLAAEAIRQRQQALLELADHTRWRQYFQAQGPDGHAPQVLFPDKLNAEAKLENPRRLKRILIIFPAVSVTLVLLWTASAIPWLAMLPAVFTNILILYLYRKKVDAFYRVFGNQTRVLNSYLELFHLAEKKEFQSELLKQLREQLTGQGQKASSLITTLQRIMGFFDSRSNFFVIIIGQFLFLWDLFCVYKLDRWQQKYQSQAGVWFDAVCELDALSSLANLNHNHPEWALPLFQEGEFCLAANDLAHPLIGPAKRVGNDLRMNGNGRIIIITGANMAGKSTFLRTVGVNMILAMNGCRVCASWMTMKPVRLFTNMRTTDNLRKEESYFLAELRRLQQMLSLLHQNIPLFILIDEMLKGTNSADKLSGSKSLLEQLIRLKSNGMVATHDLSLTEMEKQYPENITNLCFEINLEGDDFIFDYKLRAGATHTMNASFLMKKMGIIH